MKREGASRVKPTFGGRPKDAYWAAVAERTWKRVRADLLPRMKGGERTIQVIMIEPMTTEVAMIWLDRIPETEPVDLVLFHYDEVQPDDGSDRYWAVEAGEYPNLWLMETGSLKIPLTTRTAGG